jgi:16S rRNA (guanine527-N7)-methyltransferase
LTEGERRQLVDVLEQAREWGFVGPGDLDAHVEHSLAFLPLCGPAQAGTDLAVDLGSGGGLPGLVLALVQVDRPWLLLDANRRRTDFLITAVRQLGIGDRTKVICQRAEVAGRGPLRNSATLVVARGFAAPGPTAECAAPLLGVDGMLVVAEPPGGAPTRWPATQLADLGLDFDSMTTEPVALRRFRQVRPCPDRYPRRVGIPVKRPLF